MSTLKQKKAVAKISENLRNLDHQTIGEILREVGYSESTSLSPTLITESKGFRELMEEAGITDDKLAKVLDEGLKATKIFSSHTEPDKDIPDFPTRHKYLETGLKLKGHAKDAPLVNINMPIALVEFVGDSNSQS